MMGPIRIFLFFLTLLALVFLLSVLFPKEGIKITDDFTLRFFDPERILQEEEPAYKDISDIIDSTTVLQDKPKSTSTLSWNECLIVDTLNAHDYPLQVADTIAKDTSIRQADSFKEVLHSIELPPGEQGDILRSFFAALDDLSIQKQLVRILHFGDSQIEGDRITSYIRDQFQKRFGGTGPGLFPVRPSQYDHMSLNMNLSSNWRHYSIKEKDRLPSEYRDFGLLFQYSRYATPGEAKRRNDKTYKARIDIDRPSYSYKTARRYKKFRLFYSHLNKPCIVQMHLNDQTLDAEILEPTDRLKVLSWRFEQPPQNFSLQFEGPDSPNVHAIALDDRHGVAVDNIPMRGSSGLEFGKTDPAFFQSMYEKLHVKLILMQFGVNVVPNIKKDYAYYQQRLYNQLMFLKRIGNDVPIIVLGVSDMSRKLYGNYVSYPNIEKIRDAQKKAAFKAGCAFWDVYQAMGGKNSMPSWVFADPPLARKDFVHFTQKGSKLIGEMFTNALLKKYEQYKRNH